MRMALLLALALGSAGCNTLLQPPGMIERWTNDWKRVVTEDDRTRLREWRTTFAAAIDSANKAGHSADVAREGVLLDPDAALANPAIPDGMYRCRVVKVGSKEKGNLAFISYPGFTCRVRPDHKLQRLTKLSGSQRYAGIIFPQDQIRQVFLGTLVLSDERRALQYAQDDTRDIAGNLERIGPQRWRLVMPKPHFESQLDVMELVPLPPGAR